MATTTKPYLIDLDYRGFIEGLTYIDSKTDTPLCHWFGGIPYASPPIGPFRWRRPRPLPPCYKLGTRANPGRYNGGAALCPQPAYRGPPKVELHDEDCLQLNVWVPAGSPPADGWPVFFFIHGGWLQFGTPNTYSFLNLLSETAAQCIVVAPAYRLNVFGFLASRELEDEGLSTREGVGNYGFWDQRLALEWTYKNISYFGGNAGNITLGGHSAGAHSTFQQLSYDLFQAEPKNRMVKRAIMLSNGSGVQPKTVQEAQQQFDALLTALSIPLSLTGPEKLSRLRNTNHVDLLRATEKLALHEFRAVTDGQFVSKTLFELVNDGAFAGRLKERNIELMLGECKDENFVYGSWRPPQSDSLQSLQIRLNADYPSAVVKALLPFYCPDGKLPTWKPCKDWTDAFGHIYADLQVHALQRGLIGALVKGGAGHLVHRYRIDWRAKCVDASVPKEWGVTHGTDLAIWFWGQGSDSGLTTKEKEALKGLWTPFAHFLLGKKLEWGVQAPVQMKRVNTSGVVDTWNDDDWKRGLKVWDIVQNAQDVAGDKLSAKF